MTTNKTAVTTENAFPDRLPIGIGNDGRAVLLYLVLPSARGDFRAYLRRHAALLRVLPSWTLRLAIPRAIADVHAGIQSVIREEFESPLHAHTVDELRWYFEQLRAAPNPSIRPRDERFMRAAEAFERPRFYALFRRWLRDGDGVLEGVSSTVINDALATGAGRVKSLILPHRYDHLSPLIDTVGSRSRGAEKGAEKGEQGGERTPARSRPYGGNVEVSATDPSPVDGATAAAPTTV